MGPGSERGVRGSRTPISAKKHGSRGSSRGKGRGLGGGDKAREQSKSGGREAGVWARVVDGTSNEVMASTGSKGRTGTLDQNGKPLRVMYLRNL